MTIDIYISNISEDVWSFIDTMHSQEKQYEIDENAYLSDRELFMLNPSVKSYLVVPQPLEESFVDYYRRIFNNTNFEVLSPSKHSGRVSSDILADQKLWSKLVSLGKEHTLNLKSYSASAEFYELIVALKEAGCEVDIGDSPAAENAWTVNFFGSKSGVRQVTENLEKKHSPSGSWIADGLITHSVEAAVGIATRQYQKGGVVLKTNKAHSGAGVEIIAPGTISSDQSSCREYFRHLVYAQQYWSAFPIIVEEYQHLDSSEGGGNPSCEFRVTQDGEVEFLYVCGMRIDDEGVFKGVEIHNTVLSKPVLEQLLEYGRALGEVYRDAGYIGYYDVDCMYTQSEKLLVTESNVRRTGGTHVYLAGLQLLKDKLNERFILSSSAYQLPSSQKWRFDDVLKKLEQLVFDTTTQEGVILASSNLLKQNKLSYIIFGKDRTSAENIEQKMIGLLS